MATSSRADSTAKKDVQKLQRAIVDGLEDVKAQEIQVFDTENLSALFERVVVASGTSNRQTKALAASVTDAVRKAGFPKPRVEGEDNGEWIIVDCGAAVVHVMQPNIRQYYRLEELWGEKPVRLKLGSAKPALPSPPPVPAKKAASAKTPTLRRSSAAKIGAQALNPPKTKARKPTPSKATAGKTSVAKPAAKPATQKVVVKPHAAPKKTAAKSAPKKPSKA